MGLWDFNDAAEDNIPKKGRPLVNYVWINSRKAETSHEKPVCTIDLAQIDLILHNASLYPEADFWIWVDMKLPGEYSIACLENLVEQESTQGNVTLCNLQNIPDYADDSYFV